MNVLQYKPKEVVSYKKWLVITIILISFFYVTSAWLSYIIGELSVTVMLGSFATLLALKMLTTKNVQEIRVSNGQLKIWVMWIDMFGRTKSQEFDIDETLNLKVGPYEEPWWMKLRPHSLHNEWTIQISQKQKGRYYALGKFDPEILEDLDDEIRAILKRIGKEQ